MVLDRRNSSRWAMAFRRISRTSLRAVFSCFWTCCSVVGIQSGVSSFWRRRKSVESLLMLDSSEVCLVFKIETLRQAWASLDEKGVGLGR